MGIYHIVLIKYTEGTTDAQKQAWKDGVTTFASSIPQIQELLNGTKLPHLKDGGWEDGVIMKFKDEDDLKAFVEAKPHRDYQVATADQTADKLIFDLKV